MAGVRGWGVKGRQNDGRVTQWQADCVSYYSGVVIAALMLCSKALPK